MKFFLSFIFSLYFLISFGHDTLNICSFNIQFLGHFKERENAVLAEILKDHDIVVVQEMVTPPVAGKYPNGTAYKKDTESAAFVAEMKKKGFSFWLSEDNTGPKKNHTATTGNEWWIVFYKSATVVPDSTRFYGFVSQPLAMNENYQRVPYAFPFKSKDGKSNFTLVPVHLQPGNSSDQKEIRKKELNGIFTWVTKQTEKNKDFYILGDCNIYDQSEFISYKTSDIMSLNEDCQSTNTKKYESATKGQPYDHVFYRSFSNEDLLKNSFEVIDLKQEIIDNSQPGQFVLEPYVHDDFRTKFSDHVPVSFQIISGKDTDL